MGRGWAHVAIGLRMVRDEELRAGAGVKPSETAPT